MIDKKIIGGDVRMLLDSIVKDMIRKHTGGENFFDNLDASVQNENLVEVLWKMIPYEFRKRKLTISSGKFGRFISNIHDIGIVVNGGLRKGEPVDDLSYLKNSIRGHSFIFLDDSFYSGRTRDSIEAELKKYGAYIEHTFVVYDGSPEKDPNVSSIYRYYDYFGNKIKGNF